MKKVAQIKILSAKDIFLYLFFGFLTVLVSVVSYGIIIYVFGINVLLANVISWFLSVAFAYFTNSIYVFNNFPQKCVEIVRQAGLFLGARVFTLFIEEMILFILILKLGYSEIYIKLAAQFVVIICNYWLSKKYVF